MNDTLAQEIRRVSQITGEFKLRSGRIEHEYFDKYLFEADPNLLGRIAERMVTLIPEGTEVLAGLEMGGIPVVTMLAHFSGIPAAFVRKEAKKYGTARLAEGADIVGKRVLVVEDVVTSGGQIVQSSSDLRKLGAEIDAALCVIDRQQGGRENLARNGIGLISFLRKAELE